MTTLALPINWTAAGLNFLIMIPRLLLRGYKGRKLEVGDMIAIALIGLNWAHAATVHMTIADGNDGMTDQYQRKDPMQELSCREVGSELLLLAWTENVT